MTPILGVEVVVEVELVGNSTSICAIAVLFTHFRQC
jgi:hypothetical protein